MDNQNSTNNQAFLDQDQEYDDLFAEFYMASIPDLITKYGQKKLIEKIFGQNENYSNFPDYLNLQRQLLIARFIPTNKNIILTNLQKQQIVDLLASIKPEMDPGQILQSIQQVQPELQLPEDFQITIYNERALKIFNVFDKIKTIILDHLAEEYLIDTLAIYKLNEPEITNIRNEITEISEKFEQEFIGIEENKIKAVNQALIDQAANLLERIGRSQFFIKSEKEKASLNHLTDIFIKLDVAAQVAVELKTQTNINEENLRESALNQIKQVLKLGIQI